MAVNETERGGYTLSSPGIDAAFLQASMRDCFVNYLIVNRVTFHCLGKSPNLLPRDTCFS